MAKLYPYLVMSLEDWGKYRILGIPGLSYSTESQLAKWIKWGIIVPEALSYLRTPDSGRSYRMGSDAAQLDTKIQGLDPKLNLVLWAEYVGKQGEGATMEQRFIAAGCSKNTYYKRLGDAHVIVASWLHCPVYDRTRAL